MAKRRKKAKIKLKKKLKKEEKEEDSSLNLLFKRPFFIKKGRFFYFSF